MVLKKIVSAVSGAVQISALAFGYVGGMRTLAVEESAFDAGTGIVAQAALAAPTGVKTTLLSANSVKVSWNAVTGAEGYGVYRSDSQNGTYKFLSYVTSTSRDCTGLTAGKTYYFKVRAYKTVNGTKSFGSYSNVVSATTKSNAPQTPTGLTVKENSPTSLYISWNAVNNAEGYAVYRSTTKDGTYSFLANVSNTSRYCASLTPGKTYYFKVRAFKTVNGKKVYSAYTSAVSGTPVLPVPDEVTAKCSSMHSITVRWSSVSPFSDGVEVFRSDSKTGTYKLLGSVDGHERECGSLTLGKTYYFKVRAFMIINGKKAYSAFSPVVSDSTKLDTPCNFAFVEYMDGRGTYEVDWDDVELAKGYEVLVSESKSGEDPTVYTVYNPQFITDGISNGRSLYLRIRAFGTVGGKTIYSEYSNMIGLEAS